MYVCVYIYIYIQHDTDAQCVQVLRPSQTTPPVHSACDSCHTTLPTVRSMCVHSFDLIDGHPLKQLVVSTTWSMPSQHVMRNTSPYRLSSQAPCTSQPTPDSRSRNMEIWESDQSRLVSLGAETSPGQREALELLDPGGSLLREVRLREMGSICMVYLRLLYYTILLNSLPTMIILYYSAVLYCAISYRTVLLV